MSRFLAVGDIHGCAQTFRHLLMTKFQLQKSDVVVCLGDYIDRGPDSKGVIDFVIKLRDSGYTIHTLRGNHEQLMMDSVGGNGFLKELWIDNGGDKTLQSFGVRNYGELEDGYKMFFEATQHYLVHENFIFVHAGLNLQIEDPFEDKRAMLWIRDFEANEFLEGRILVHGHTPIKIENLLAQLPSNIINIDGGCVYGKIGGYGNLVGYNITEQEFIPVRNRDL